MPSGANDFLRRHPEIVQAWEQAYNDLDYLDGRLRGYEATTRTIPAILAAHEADLAGDVDFARWKDTEGQSVVSADAAVHECAAAYLAGRLRGREEAAKVAETYRDDVAKGLPLASDEWKDEASGMFNAANDLVYKIRSLP